MLSFAVKKNEKMMHDIKKFANHSDLRELAFLRQFSIPHKAAFFPFLADYTWHGEEKAAAGAIFTCTLASRIKKSPARASEMIFAEEKNEISRRFPPKIGRQNEKKKEEEERSHKMAENPRKKSPRFTESHDYEMPQETMLWEGKEKLRD